MNKIGFQNFRRFENFPTLECGPITFLVGRNNAGKSTLVKAFMLVNNYLTNKNLLEFPIGENILEEVNIVTYGRALHQPSRENCIRFFAGYNEFDIQITITGNENDTKAFVTQLLIIDNTNQIEYDYNWKTLTVKRKIIQPKTEEDFGALLNKVENEISKHEIILQEMGGKKSTREFLEMVDVKNQLQAKREDIISKIAANPDSKAFSEYSISVPIDYADSFNDLINSFLSKSLSIYRNGYEDISNMKEAPENFDSFRAFYEDQSIYESSIDHFLEVITNIKFVYLSANSCKQSALLSIRDKKNELAQSVHLHHTGLHVNDVFVKKWMKVLEVGESYDIIPHAGEAYEVKILTDNQWIQLSDMGMGSIQVMQLLFRIANILDNQMIVFADEEESKLKTIFIEEPELNLHPALQGKLADLFLEAYEKYNIRFIIETHSEYLIRRSQVLVIDKDLEVAPNENPFCVYYFPKEHDQFPYRMKYQSDGVFDKNFGEGFFDAASSSTLELLRLKRQKLA